MRSTAASIWFKFAAVAGTVLLVSVATRPGASTGAARPLLEGAQISPDVRRTIERSCQDCHSEATTYPWYSYIAPVSWLVKQDVEQGRKHLNFSRWAQYSVIRRDRCLSEIANQIRDRGMPLRIYTLIHRDATLSDAEVDALFTWTQTERKRLIMERLTSH